MLRGGSRYLFGGTKFSNRKLREKPEIEGVKRPRIEGEARVEGVKILRIEDEARTEGEAREKTGRGVWGGGSVSLSPEDF